MHTVTYSKSATRALRRIQRNRAVQIVGAIKELATHETPALHPNVKQMKGDYKGFYRLRVGNYRAIFALDPDSNAAPDQKLLLISVSAIGTRQGIY